MAKKGVIHLLSIYKTIDQKVVELDEIQEDCWIHLCKPTEEELTRVMDTLHIDSDLLRAALDEEESSRIDILDGQKLIIVDLPVVERGESVSYSTLPLGIIVCRKYIITVCLKESPVIRDFQRGAVQNIYTQQKTNFLFKLLLRVANHYLISLKQIDKIYNSMEQQLYRSQRNRELLQLLNLEKSLVYFNTSLKANEVTLKKILRGRTITLYEEDQDLLEDVLIEVHQAIEMTNIYSSILTVMMDAFASVINNNLNVTMKTLTIFTVMLTVPNIVFGFYGMNVAGLPLDQFWWFPLVITTVLVGIVGLVLRNRKLF